MGFWIRGLTDEEIKPFKGNGKQTRHLKMYSLDDMDEKRIVKLMKMVAKKATPENK